MMEGLLLEKWRSLSSEQQQAVLRFMDLLDTHAIRATDPAFQPARTPLGQKLRDIRAQIIASGAPLLTAEEVEREVAERRGGYQGIDE
ncbi:MAG: hypothetical protein HC925_07200 [Coleofasciculaceae cyanobacterium SM2_3_26]|nr:hypothetical protein [Coleofasciculaceae cyanobacterium SM2_3_26]